MATGLLVFAVCLPLYLGKVSMNKWYGVRFEKSYSSSENWYKINRYGAFWLMVWSLPIVGVGIYMIVARPEEPTEVAVLAFFPLVVLIPALQSWRYARSLPD